HRPWTLSAGATLPTTTSPYHDHFRHPRKTGIFYFAQNRNFLLCLDTFNLNPNTPNIKVQPGWNLTQDGDGKLRNDYQLCKKRAVESRPDQSVPEIERVNPIRGKDRRTSTWKKSQG
ncbi:MAG TPA: hypothetical protein VHW72_11430, partial [Candidatus Angelobacter sp.]|nr:hypothetical protein [Candidatus Angelobacter sp.]